MQVITERPNGFKRVQIFFDQDPVIEKMIDGKLVKTNKFGPSRNRCKPEFFKESRIDQIMAKAMRTGLVSVKPNAYFGDFTTGQSFLDVQNRIIRLHQYFDSLPSSTRDFFANDPKNYLDFVADPRNKDQAIEMGLIEKPAVAPAPPAPAVVTAISTGTTPVSTENSTPPASTPPAPSAPGVS